MVVKSFTWLLWASRRLKSKASNSSETRYQKKPVPEPAARRPQQNPSNSAILKVENRGVDQGIDRADSKRRPDSIRLIDRILSLESENRIATEVNEKLDPQEVEKTEVDQKAGCSC